MEKNVETAVIGAGPAGLCAAIRLAELGIETVVLDEKPSAGGQLFKQIHKFFGSEMHMAGVRGFEIGNYLLERCTELKIPVHLDTAVWGLYPDLTLAADKEGEALVIHANGIIAATGAGENGFAFTGWTLPGIMGAGAAQTMVNFYRVRPGERAIIVGAGNVGLIVAYQLLQAGIEVAAVVEALPSVGGYSVHASKVRRMSIPIFTNHTILRADGTDRVERCTIAAIDKDMTLISGTEKIIDTDLICLAVGLSPAVELLRTIHVPLCYISELGGYIPLHNEDMMTKMGGLFIAGDVSGIEEASSAMEEGRLAAISTAKHIGKIDEDEYENSRRKIRASLEVLRDGPFGKNASKGKNEIYRRFTDEAK